MRRIAMLGATGKLGDKIVARALDRGFAVNALVRDPTRLTRQNEALTVISGDATTGAGLDALVDRCSLAICAVGGLMPVVDVTLQHLVPALQKLKRFERLVLVSRLGTGESLEQSHKVSGAIQQRLPVLLKPIFRDLNLGEERVRTSSLPWTIVRSTRLTDDPPTRRVVTVGPHDPPPHRITLIDFAQYIVSLLETQEHLREELTVGSA